MCSSACASSNHLEDNNANKYTCNYGSRYGYMHIHTYLPAYLPIYDTMYLPMYVRTYLHTYMLHTYVHAYTYGGVVRACEIIFADSSKIPTNVSAVHFAADWSLPPGPCTVQTSSERFFIRPFYMGQRREHYFQNNTLQIAAAPRKAMAASPIHQVDERKCWILQR